MVLVEWLRAGCVGNARCSACSGWCSNAASGGMLLGDGVRVVNVRVGALVGIVLLWAARGAQCSTLVKKNETIVYTSRFVCVILAQGPC